MKFERVHKRIRPENRIPISVKLKSCLRCPERNKTKQNSEKEKDFVILRQRAIRKLKRLVDKCCKKRIKFSQKYFNISKRLASNPSSVTDAELMELQTECLESLEACNVSFSSSSTSESGQEEPLKVKKKKLKRKSLVQSPPMYDPTNPYSVAYQMNPMYSRGT